jgi:hypothetical protein
MVVGMLDMIPVPASSVREATPEESEAYIDEWISEGGCRSKPISP